MTVPDDPARGFIKDDWLTFVAHIWIGGLVEQQPTRVNEPPLPATINHKVPHRHCQGGKLKESALSVLPMNRLLDLFMEKGESLNCICLALSNEKTVVLVLTGVSAPTVAGCFATEDPNVRSVKPK